MALITIKDLAQSDDLDREAMRSVVGGGLTGPQPLQIDQVKAGSARIVDWPPGFCSQGRGPLSARRPKG